MAALQDGNFLLEDIQSGSAGSAGRQQAATGVGVAVLEDLGSDYLDTRLERPIHLHSPQKPSQTTKV